MLREQEYYSEPWGGNEEPHKDGCLGIVIGAVLAGLVCALMGGCRTKYVSVPEWHTEYVAKTDSFVVRDSVYERDSVYVVRNGDSIAIYKTRLVYRDRWRDRWRVDSFIRRDSVRVPYPVVTNKVRWQDKAAYIGTGIAVCLVASGLIFVFLRLWKWLRARSMI